MDKLLGVAGIALILLIAFLLSSNKRGIRLRVVAAAFALQALFAALTLYRPAGHVTQGCKYFDLSNGLASSDSFRSTGHETITCMAQGVSNLLSYANKGTEFLFGPAANNPLANTFAIAALPVIVFFAALVAILYYLGVMQRVVRWVGGAIGWLTGISRVEALGSAANIFVGQSESPLVVRPYLANLTQPGGILMAKIMMPDAPRTDELPLEEGKPAEERVDVAETFEEGEQPANIIMAAAQGAQTGVKLAVAVGAMVLAFVALVALANGLLGGVGGWFGHPDLSFQQIVGYIFQPIMFLIGVPWNEAGVAGGLFGTKIVLNEFVAFIDLGALQAGQISERSRAIVTFALCGFANFSSIAIQMAVTGGLAPNQRPVIAKLGIKALIAGSLANLMSAALAGLLIP
jgi:CNT family concentrative nucleoside transporter